MIADENKQDLIADFELEEIEYQEETESQAEAVTEGNNDSKIADYCRLQWKCFREITTSATFFRSAKTNQNQTIFF